MNIFANVFLNSFDAILTMNGILLTQMSSLLIVKTKVTLSRFHGNQLIRQITKFELLESIMNSDD